MATSATRSPSPVGQDLTSAMRCSSNPYLVTPTPSGQSPVAARLPASAMVPQQVGLASTPPCPPAQRNQRNSDMTRPAGQLKQLAEWSSTLMTLSDVQKPVALPSHLLKDQVDRVSNCYKNDNKTATRLLHRCCRRPSNLGATRTSRWDIGFTDVPRRGHIRSTGALGPSPA